MSDQLFKLAVGKKTDDQNVLEVNNATIELSWTLTKKGLSLLESKQICEPFMLIVVVSRNSQNNELIEEDLHQLVPLANKSSFVPFFRPGENHIHASIVFQKSESDFYDYHGGMTEYYLEADDYTKQYYHKCLDDKGRFKLNKLHIGHQVVKVEVANELFAPPPSAFSKKVLRFIHGGEQPVDDQCQMRELWLKAFPVVIWYGSKTLYRILVALFCLLVPLKINWEPIISPRTTSYKDIYEDTEPIWLYTFYKKNSDSHCTWYLFFVSPIYLIITFVLLLALKPNNYGVTLIRYIIVSIGITVAIFVVIAILFGLYVAYEAIREKKAKEEHNKTISERYEGLLEGNKPEFTMTVKLNHNFYKVKSIVCKPFARK